MRAVIGERIIDLVIDFWEDCYDSLDKIKEKIGYKPIVERFNHIHNLY